MKELFKKQLEGFEPITEERFNQLQQKKYFDGTEINPGDVVLYGIMFEGQDNENYFNFRLIKLNESHFDMFEEYTLSEQKSIPYIKLKK